MLETNADSVKRYAPPPQRSRSLNRRKSGDRYENINFSYGNEGEKIHVSYARNGPIIDHVDVGGQNIQNEHAHPGLIPLDGCHTSEAAKLLNERWAAAMHSCNAHLDISERPVMYSGASGSSWGHLKLPHQMDFMGELQRAILAAQSGMVLADGEHN